MAATGEIPALEIFGDDYPTPDGTCIRDYVHVTDLAEAHVRSMEYLGRVGLSQPINLGTGQGFSIRQVLAAVEEITGKAVPHVISARRAGDPSVLIADSLKTMSKLDWEPKNSSLRNILITAWKWTNR